MGAAPSSNKIILDDGTDVGYASKDGLAFAQAIQRMHNIFRSCDAEFTNLSEAVNTHGKKSAETKAAAAELQTCQRRREFEFAAIETRCGPAQYEYQKCAERVQQSGVGRESQCLPVLHSFIDCAERALERPAKEDAAR